MEGSAQPTPTQSTERQRVRELASQYAAAWHSGTSADLRRFLPSEAGPFRRAALVELVKTDLILRWQRGQRLLLEAYLGKLPELGTAADLPVELVWEEYRIRQAAGETVDLQSYRGRFPRQYPELAQRGSSASSSATPHGDIDVPTRAPSGSAGLVKPPDPDGTQKIPQPAGTMLQTVGGYKMFERLGSGSFAEVWRGEAPGGFPVAIKRIMKPLDHEQAQRELQSLEQISKLRHPFLLKTDSYHLIDNHLYVVMELADGTLRDRAKDCAKAKLPGVPLPELLRYFHEAAEAIDYMHANNVIHRDIKPHNILISKGHAKVADFGLARLQEEQEPLATASGSGTPAYMAPESWRRKVHRNSDQYSLAITYAEQRLGHWPFPSKDIVGLMQDHLMNRPQLDPLPPAEQKVLHKALAKDPAQRYPTCTALVEALEQALAGALPVHRPLSGSASGIHGADSTHLTGTGEHTLEMRALGATIRATSRGMVVLVAALVFAVVVGAGLTWWFVVQRGIKPFEFIEPAPLVLAPGEAKKLTLQIKRNSAPGPVNITVDEPPPLLHVGNTVLPADATSVEVDVHAAPDAAAGSVPITIHATVDGNEQTTQLQLQIADKPAYALPKGWVKAPGAELREVDGKVYYSEIDVLRDGFKVAFLLIPHSGKGPPTFYMMRDKVWVALYRAFADAHAKELVNDEWKNLTYKDPNRPGKQPLNGPERGECPVMGVVIADADRFAEWMGGRLPNTDEWDKAAGLFEPNRTQEGPFKKRVDDWKGIGVNVPAPLPRQESTNDEGPFRCRQMAGNGEEWTDKTEVSDSIGSFRGLSPEKKLDSVTVFLRGKNYHKEEPLFYAKENDSACGVYESTFVEHNHEHVGFRVALILER
jgi:hypothetical protein